MFIRIKTPIETHNLEAFLRFLGTGPNETGSNSPYQKGIDAIDFTNYNTIAKTFNSYIPIAPERFAIESDKLWRDLLSPIDGWKIIGSAKITLSHVNRIGRDAIVKANVCFDVLAEDNLHIIKNKQFEIDLIAKRWLNHLNRESGNILIRDLNVPDIISTNGKIFSQSFLEKELSKDIVLKIALIQFPQNNCRYIDFDVIEYCRFMMKRDGIIEQEDLDFLSSEKSFLVLGKEHAFQL